MRYCYNCDRVTAGEPLYCNFCGRSYNVKLCPRRHANPRNAEACSQCGSRDLSTPQPKPPFWAPFLEFVVTFIPGILLAFVTLLILGLFIGELEQHPILLVPFLMLAAALGVLWWLWSQIPSSIRRFVYQMLKRKRDGDERHGGGS